MVDILVFHDYLFKYNRRTHKHMSQIHLDSSVRFAKVSFSEATFSFVYQCNHCVLSEREEVVEALPSGRGVAESFTACPVQYYSNL